MIRLSVSRSLAQAAVITVLCVAATGCGGGREYVLPTTPGTGNGTTPGTPPGPAPTGVAKIQVSLASGSTSISVGETLQLSAVALDAQGKQVSGVAFTWQSSDPSIAEVSATGLVRAKELGAVQVTASGAGKTSDPLTITVKVEEELPPGPPGPPG